MSLRKNIEGAFLNQYEIIFPRHLTYKNPAVGGNIYDCGDQPDVSAEGKLEAVASMAWHVGVAKPSNIAELIGFSIGKLVFFVLCRNKVQPADLKSSKLKYSFVLLFDDI
jgi:hypothetical protein